MYFSCLKIKNYKVKKYIKFDDKDIFPFALFVLILVSPRTIFAAEDKKSISESLQPLIDVLQELAEPVSYGFMIKGFLQLMAGSEHEGKKTIKYAASGYLGIQFIPQIFKILKGIQF